MAQTLGARGVLPGTVIAAVAPMRILGAVLLVVGLIMVGSSARARRRAAAGDSATERSPTAGRLDPVYAGLAVVLLGLFLREPSAAGAIAAGVAAPFLAWPALTSRGAPDQA